MSASYEKLIEEFYKADKSKLERALESDAKEILNDAVMRNLLHEYIVRLDKDTNFEANSMRAIRYFELLSSIHNLEDFQKNLEDLNNFCSNESDLKIDDESSLHRFIHAQKHRTYRKVDESHEYRRFKEYLRRKYRTRRVR